MKKCPSCGKDALHRLISAPVFRLKGSGWYETDFKSDKENKRNLVDTGTDGKEPAPASDSDDKKPKARASKVVRKALNKSSVVARPVAAKAAARPKRKLSRPVRKAARKAAKPPAKKPSSKKLPKQVAAKKKSSAAKSARASRKPARKK